MRTTSCSMWDLVPWPHIGSVESQSLHHQVSPPAQWLLNWSSSSLWILNLMAFRLELNYWLPWVSSLLTYPENLATCQPPQSHEPNPYNLSISLYIEIYVSISTYLSVLLDLFLWRILRSWTLCNITERTFPIQLYTVCWNLILGEREVPCYTLRSQ